MRSVSKAYGPDLRVATVIGDEITIGRVEGRAQLGPGWVSTVLQQVVIGLWQDPVAGDAVERARQVYADRRRALAGRLADRGVDSAGAGGINLWVPVPDETAVVSGLLLGGWVVAPGARFRIRSGPGIRITLGPAAAETSFADAVADAVAGPASSGSVPRSV